MTDPSPSTAAAPAFDFNRDLVALIPFLRAFARSLCRHREQAEDLAQEALAKAWRARMDFQPGTNLKAWLFAIMRNELHSRNRRAWRQTAWDEEAAQNIPAPPDAQFWSIELGNTAHALHGLPADQREAVILVGAAGFTYEEAAEICGTPIGTIKSRVARGRQALLEMLGGNRVLTRLPSVSRDGGFTDILAQLSALAAGGTLLPAYI